MVTEPGTARLVELELRLTVLPPVPLRVTVQVVEVPGETRVEAAQLRPERVAGADREMVVATDEPFFVAVTVTV
jgi:hypothetical protein